MVVRWGVFFILLSRILMWYILFFVVILICWIISSFFDWKKSWWIFDLLLTIFYLIYFIYFFIHLKTYGALEIVLWIVVLACIVYNIYRIVKAIKRGWINIEQLKKQTVWCFKNIWIIILGTIVVLWLCVLIVYVIMANLE